VTGNVGGVPLNGLKRNGNVHMGNSPSSGTVSRAVSLKVWFAVARRVLRAGAAAAITLVFLGACVVAPLLHIGFAPVLTGSMRPAYAPVTC
jgi:hypothetical protein